MSSFQFELCANPPADVSFLSFADPQIVFGPFANEAQRSQYLTQLGWHVISLPETLFSTSANCLMIRRLVQALQGAVQFVKFEQRRPQQEIDKLRAIQRQMKQEKDDLFEEVVELRDLVSLLRLRMDRVKQQQLEAHVQHTDKKAAQESAKRHFSCLICNKEYPSTGSLQSHLRKRHPHAMLDKSSFAAAQLRDAGEKDATSATVAPAPSAAPAVEVAAANGEHSSEFVELKQELVEMKDAFKRVLDRQEAQATKMAVPQPSLNQPALTTSLDVSLSTAASVEALALLRAQQHRMEVLEKAVIDAKVSQQQRIPPPPTWFYPQPLMLNDGTHGAPRLGSGSLELRPTLGRWSQADSAMRVSSVSHTNDDEVRLSPAEISAQKPLERPSSFAYFDSTSLYSMPPIAPASPLRAVAKKLPMPRATQQQPQQQQHQQQHQPAHSIVTPPSTIEADRTTPGSNSPPGSSRRSNPNSIVPIVVHQGSGGNPAAGGGSRVPSLRAVTERSGFVVNESFNTPRPDLSDLESARDVRPAAAPHGLVSVDPSIRRHTTDRDSVVPQILSMASTPRLHPSEEGPGETEIPVVKVRPILLPQQQRPVLQHNRSPVDSDDELPPVRGGGGGGEKNGPRHGEGQDITSVNETAKLEATRVVELEQSATGPQGSESGAQNRARSPPLNAAGGEPASLSATVVIPPQSAAAALSSKSQSTSDGSSSSDESSSSSSSSSSSEATTDAQASQVPKKKKNLFSKLVSVIRNRKK